MEKSYLEYLRLINESMTLKHIINVNYMCNVMSQPILEMALEKRRRIKEKIRTKYKSYKMYEVICNEKFFLN